MTPTDSLTCPNLLQTKTRLQQLALMTQQKSNSLLLSTQRYRKMSSNWRECPSPLRQKSRMMTSFPNSKLSNAFKLSPEWLSIMLKNWHTAKNCSPSVQEELQEQKDSPPLQNLTLQITMLYKSIWSQQYKNLKSLLPQFNTSCAKGSATDCVTY